jgi:hypothetical protein
MRIVVCLAVLLATGTASGQDMAIRASTATLVPLQMPDGSKLWRWAGQPPKGEAAEILLTDLLAQALARAQWCSSGWEETRRTPVMGGTTVIEGRCK